MTAHTDMICAWCRGPASTSGESASHGICVDCAVELLRRLPRDFLESVAEPDGTVMLFSGKRMDIDSGEAR